MTSIFSGIFKTAFFVLASLVLFAACNHAQVRQKPESAAEGKTAAYTFKSPHPDGIGKVYMGREIAGIMGSGGGNWLDRDTRQEEEDVTAAIARMPLSPASVVADIGAGTGYYSFRIAPRVPQGKVWAVEVQEEFIAALKKQKAGLGLNQVEVVQGSRRSPNLPEASIDLALMVDVYHELEFPQEMLRAIHQALKPEGKLLLLEYRAEDPAIPIKALHKMSAAQVNKELEANGFSLVKKEDFLPIQHFLLFARK
jgi:SAM-dependent methyltransferase